MEKNLNKRITGVFLIPERTVCLINSFHKKMQSIYKGKNHIELRSDCRMLSLFILNCFLCKNILSKNMCVYVLVVIQFNAFPYLSQKEKKSVNNY